MSSEYYRNRTDEQFIRDYERETKGFQIHAEKSDPNDEDRSEGHFSWSACDTCGSTLGGDRFDCVLTNPGKRARSVDVSSCADCLRFAANGQLPSEE